MTDLDDVRKVFSNGRITGVAIALGGKTKDVGTTMLTDGEDHNWNNSIGWCAFDISVPTLVGQSENDDTGRYTAVFGCWFCLQIVLLY